MSTTDSPNDSENAQAPIPRVSVFVSVYNGDKWLEEAMDSIFAQTETDFEVIVVDDGSTDDTKAILANYDDPRLRIITKQNEGLGTPLNPLLRECRGKYLLRADADDICLPERMRIQADFLDENPEVVIVGSQLRHFTESRVGGSSTLPLTNSEIVQGMRHSIHTISHPTTMWRRSLLDDIEGYLWDGAGEDWSLLLESARHGQLANVNEVLYHRRIHGASASSQGAQGVLEGFAFARKRYDSYLEGDPNYSLERFLSERNEGPIARLSLAARVRSSLWQRRAQAERFDGNDARAVGFLGLAALLNPRVAAGAVWKFGRSVSSDRDNDFRNDDFQNEELSESWHSSLGELSEPAAGGSSVRVAQLVYDCIPDAGSDPGIGWHAVVAASGAGFHVHAITKASNRSEIEAAPPLPNVQWHFIDVPESVGPMSTGRTVGDTVHLFRWLRVARKLCLSLASRGEIELTNFVTFSAFWMPVPLADLPVPHVFGPVGGGERVPKQLSGNFSDRASADFRQFVQTSFTRTPEWQELVLSPKTTVISAGRATTDRLTKLGVDVFETGATGCLTDSLIESLDDIQPIKEPGTTLVASGRQLRWKGHDLAVAAMPAVLKEFPNARLEILGSGPEHDALKQQVVELGLSDNQILFRTKISREEERRRIAGADAFLFPSRRDTGSTLIPLVQILGVPIVAFATGAIPDSTGGHASLADIDDRSGPTNSLAKAIIEGLRMPESTLAAARQHAIDRHGEETARSALTRWYNQAISTASV